MKNHSSATGANPAESAHAKSLHKTSEFLGLVMFVSCCTLDYVFPLLPVGLPSSLRYSVSTTLFMLGIIMIRATHKALAEYNQPHQPGRPTTRLVTTGVLQYSRHPTYFACVFLFTPSAGLLMNNSWMLLLAVPVGLPLFHYVLIEPEEKYLHQQFPEYKRYCSETYQFFWRKRKKH